MALANILHLLRHISFKRSAFECSNEHRARDCFCAKIEGHWCCFFELVGTLYSCKFHVVGVVAMDDASTFQYERKHP